MRGKKAQLDPHASHPVHVPPDLPTTSRSRLFDLHLPGVAAYLRRRCGPLLRAKESATDLAQSVCREALSCWSRFRSDSNRDESVRKWLFHIAKHKITARQRYWTAAKRGRPEATEEVSVEALANQIAVDASPSHEVLLREQIAQLEQVFAELPREYGDIIDLAYRQGLPHAEIARRLGRSEPAVRQLLSRALARLALLMQSRRKGCAEDDAPIG